MTDMLIAEVNEALRRDKAERFWVDNRKGLFALVIAVIVGTAGGQIYRTWKAEKNAHFSATLVEATQTINGIKPHKAIAPLKALVEKSSGEQRTIAQLWLARAYIQSNDKKRAHDAVLLAILQDAERGTVWYDTACVWAAALAYTFPVECDASVASPLQSTKLELAAADAISKQDWVKARPLVAKLKELSATLPEQRERANQLALLLPPAQDAKD